MPPVSKDDTTQEVTNKSPAFQFYPKDFLTDAKVIVMSCEARGAYITLLCIDWLEDGFRADRLCKLCGYDWTDSHGLLRDSESWKLIEAQLLDCFVSHPLKEGFITHPRLLKERAAQIQRREERRKSGRKGGKARYKKGLESQGQLKPSQENTQANSSPSSSSSSSSSTAYSNRDIINNISKEILETPKPKRKNASPKYKDFSRADFALPGSWGEKATSALSRWVAFKAKAGHACLLESYQEQVTLFATDPRQFVALVERAIRNGWRGLNEQIPFTGKDAGISPTGFSAAHSHNLELIRRAEEELGND